MTQRSFFWDSAVTGDADTYAPYHLGNEDYASPPIDMVFRMIFRSTGNLGVLANWDNELAPDTLAVASPVSIDTGGALVYGMPYRNHTAAVNVVIPNPTVDTRYDRIVLRRDWDAQTIRITRVAGSEGGSAPDLVQSPAPDGTGIYDIPLATVEVDTGGNLVVTDTREFVTFSTTAVANSIITASIVNEGVPFAARAQVTKRLHFGGADLLAYNTEFGYQIGSDEAQDWLDPTIAAAWGAAAASIEGWQCSGSGTGQDRGFYVAFRVPADYVPGTAIVPVLWMTDDWGGSSSFNLYSCYQVYADSTELSYSDGYTSTAMSMTSVVDTTWLAALRPITGLSGGEMVLYFVMYYNSTGVELMLVDGIDFAYQGYV